MKLRDSAESLVFERYAFRCSAAASGPIAARRIVEILPQRVPAEVWLDDGEILFVPRHALDVLLAFADRHRIPLTDRQDVWALFLEECLDTEMTDEAKERVVRDLDALGFTESEIAAIRRWAIPRVLGWNAWQWEWAHLGHFDLLWAFYGPLARLGLGRFSRVYADSMRIAARAPRRAWDESAFRLEAEACFEPALWKAWQDVGASLGVVLPRALYRRLLDAYDSPGRHYHGRWHLKKVVEALVADGASPEAQLAGWFHDAVDPSRSGAEEASARWARRELEAVGVSSSCAGRVAELVRTTADHWKLVGNDRDARALARADLAVLGAPRALYQLYASQVRLEYARVPWLLFRRGRMRFLRRLEAMARLGFDRDDAWERQARENVLWELGEWRRFRTPKWG